MSVDLVVGFGMLGIATAIFIYYTIWTFILPFVDEPHFIFNLFPPREWAIRIPVILLLIGATILGSFISLVLIRSAHKEKNKKATKAK